MQIIMMINICFKNSNLAGMM